ncbi:MAG: hypothetical protein ACRCXD_01995 [Luteolibacter sp.]
MPRSTNDIRKAQELERLAQAYRNREAWQHEASRFGGYPIRHLDGARVEFARVCFRIDMESRDWLQTHASARGQSLNMFLNDVLAFTRREKAGVAIPRHFEQFYPDKAVC